MALLSSDFCPLRRLDVWVRAAVVSTVKVGVASVPSVWTVGLAILRDGAVVPSRVVIRIAPLNIVPLSGIALLVLVALLEVALAVLLPTVVLEFPGLRSQGRVPVDLWLRLGSGVQVDEAVVELSG